jgi:hypothetical protein
MVDEPDEFTKMFEDLAKLGDEEPAKLTPIEEPAPVIVGAEPPAPVAEAPVEEPAPAEGLDLTPPAEEPAPEPEPEPVQQQSSEDILARFAQIVREQPAPQQQVQPQAQQPQPAPLFTPEEIKELEAYEKDWPDVAKAEALRRRAEYSQLISYVFQQVSQRLAPLEQQTAGVSTRSHLNDLYTLIPDYDQVRDPVLAWVDQQPAYIKNAYMQVAQQGTPAEVADLVGRYKLATGLQAKAALAAPTAPAPQVRKAAAALAPVKSARSNVTDAQPEDFDSAFAAFAKAV